MKNGDYQGVPFKKELYESITNKKNIRILDPIPEKRNSISAHGGTIPEILAERTITELNPDLNKLFGVLTAYNPLDMIYTQSMKKNNGLYSVRIKRLDGTHYPFAEDDIDTEVDMDSDVLYLYNRVTDERLKLIPELIKLINCPECGNWSVYFYSKLEGNEAKYISFQNEIHPYSCEGEDLRIFFENMETR